MIQHKHTPGPWRVMVYSSPEVVSGPDDGYTLVARPTAQNLDPKVQAQSRMADAHLIAAAPDMLEALEAHPDPRDFDGDMGLYLFAFETWRVKREAAIKKARGGE